MPADLRAERRQLVDEDDLAWDLRVGQCLRGVLAELGFELLRALGTGHRHDERADEVAAALEVADPDDGRRRDRPVPGEHALDVEGAERAAAVRDHVLRAPDEREEAFLVDVRDVAGEVPVAQEGGLRLLWKLPVAGEQGRRPAADGEVALDAGRKLVALVVDDRDVVAGERAAERAGLGSTVGEMRHHDVRLGLAVAVVDGQAPALLEHGDDLWIEEVPGRDETAEPRRAEALELGVRRKGGVLGWRLAEDARPEPEHQIEPLVGVELAFMQHDLGATRPRPDDGVPHRERRGGVARTPDGVAAADVEPVLGLDASGERRAVRVRDVLARAADARRRDDEG